MTQPAISDTTTPHRADFTDRSRDVDAFASMPPASPLEMPTQSLSRFDESRRRPHALQHRKLTSRLTRLAVFGGTLALTAYGAFEMYGVVSVGGVTVLEWALLILFAVNFSWISLALLSAVVGMIWRGAKSRKPAPSVTQLSRCTAVVLPTYTAEPARVFGALAAMIDDVEATGMVRNFHWFVLSDTTNPDIWVAEERVLLELRKRLGSRAQVFYRHRPKNTARKAGNIADFVSRWGGAYEYMLVLDADSLMTAHAVVTLAAAMEADPDAGIIQSLPQIISRNTMFARLQQFAARIYGPIIAQGLAVWSDRDGNYWGHNAIIRTRAFAASCGLPELNGPPPFGGHILSHDFIEAALMNRAGYDVYMLPETSGSYEESPPSLEDLAIRDTRWCQGNLQHVRILAAKGLRLVSRQHLATGIMSYLASPIWMAQLLVGIVLVLQARYVRPEYFTDEFALLPAWPRFDAERALWLFGVTMLVLLAPKLFGLVLALADGPTRRGSGGGARMVISTLLEIVFSALLAPIMMVMQTGAVLRIVFGKDAGWHPQRRDDGTIPFRAMVRRHFSHTMLGLITLIAGLLIAPSLVVWMSPTIAGLLLAAVLSWGTGQLSAGLVLKHWGILLTPEETKPPPIAARARALRAALNEAVGPLADALRLVHEDRELREMHTRFLPPPVEHVRGEVSSNTAVANAKLDDALSLDDAVAWLSSAERMALLHDRSLLAKLARLSGNAPLQRNSG